MQLVTEIKHWDWTTGQLTSVAYCTTHKNKCWEGCLPSMRRKCRLYNCSVTPIHAPTHLPPLSYLCDQQPPPSPLPARQPVSPALPPATSQNCALCTATTRKFSEQLVTEGGGGEESSEDCGQAPLSDSATDNKIKGETFSFLFGGIRGKKKTNKLQPARFSTVTTLFSAHLGDSFITMSINSSLRPSNATM